MSGERKDRPETAGEKTSDGAGRVGRHPRQSLDSPIPAAPVVQPADQPAPDTRPTLVARCENFREDVEQPCTGRIRYRWGQPDAACDTCDGRCGVAVADWISVEPAPDTTAGDALREAEQLWRDLINEDDQGAVDKLAQLLADAAELRAKVQRVLDIADRADAHGYDIEPDDIRRAVLNGEKP
jgi:hypothetical protein